MTHWDTFYQHFSNSQPSAFAGWVDESISVLARRHALVDIGCGNGRDTLFFAEKGFNVLAIDSSSVAISSLSRRNSRRVECVCVDALSTAVFESLVPEWRRQYSVLYYSRFFLHTVPEVNQVALLNNITKCSPKGDWLALEYRTVNDSALYKTFDDHERYYVNHPKIVEALMEMNWKIIHSSESTGVAPFGTEDPVIGRILAGR